MAGLPDVIRGAVAVGKAVKRAAERSASKPAASRETRPANRGTPVISGGRRRAAIDAVVDEVQEGSIVRR